MMTELLALVNVRNVNFNDGTFQRTNAVVQCYRGMGVGSCIEHDSVVGEANLLHFVNQFSFYIALIVFYFHVRILCL